MIFDLFYKTRYLLILPLLYLAGQWLEGPPTRVILLSNVFAITMALLLIYSVLFIRKENPEKYPYSFLLLNVLFVLTYLYMMSNYSIEVDKNFETAKGLLFGLFGIHFIYWIVSLFQRS